MQLLFLSQRQPEVCTVVFFITYGFSDAWNDQQQGKFFVQ